MTASKIDITPSAALATTLAAYIDTGNIPYKFGGSLDFQIGALPNLDSAARNVLSNALGSDSIALQGPFKWVTNRKDQRLAIATGTVQGQSRNAAAAQS